MKKLNLILLFVLGTIVLNLSSCKKKYSGCCKYAVIVTDSIYNNDQHSYSVDKCLSDVDKSETTVMSDQFDFVSQGKNNYANGHYYITGTGCLFTKNK